MANLGQSSASVRGAAACPPRTKRSAPNVSIEDAAKRLGLAKTDLLELARSWINEPTYSIAEVGARWGCGAWSVHRLIKYGRDYPDHMHPTRGGLWPTFKGVKKGRRIPLSAIERQEAFMEAQSTAA